MSKLKAIPQTTSQSVELTQSKTHATQEKGNVSLKCPQTSTKTRNLHAMQTFLFFVLPSIPTVETLQIINSHIYFKSQVVNKYSYYNMHFLGSLLTVFVYGVGGLYFNTYEVYFHELVDHIRDFLCGCFIFFTFGGFFFICTLFFKFSPE